ncbi:hypothetical protein QTP70_006400 [Hemibagrus guttatus]|uniref:Uncharacterized protein n=1 Tax=Hemibagrus guttatus TaxID=175788 RepID=A0AAE0Q9H3_9TELE|nr:hypothetical protein QTP70_006400 [Hemibagrus guttatus]
MPAYSTNMKLKFPILALSLEIITIVLYAFFVVYDVGSGHSSGHDTKNQTHEESRVSLYPNDWHPSLNCHLIVVERFEYPNEPRSHVVGGLVLLVGSPKANGFYVMGVRLRAVQNLYGSKIKDRCVARTGVTGAPPWSQAWGWGTQASAWWPSLRLRDSARHSPKERRRPPFP